MSVAYPPRLVRYAFSSKKERDSARTATIKPAFWGNFPSTIGLYFDSPGPDFLSQRFFLCSGDSSEPRQNLYAVTFHSGVGTSQMTMYSSLEHGTTPFAVAVNDGRWSGSIAITIAGKEGQGPTTERVKYSGFNTDTYRFAFQDELFEWREEERQRPRLRQLMRVTKSQNELVATFMEGSVPTRDYRLATFRFVDEAVKERLGSEWALLAVGSALAVCQRGPAIDGTAVWHEEKMLEKGNFT